MPQKHIIEQALAEIAAAQSLQEQAQKKYSEVEKWLKAINSPEKIIRKRRKFTTTDTKKLLAKPSTRFKN